MVAPRLLPPSGAPVRFPASKETTAGGRGAGRGRGNRGPDLGLRQPAIETVENWYLVMAKTFCQDHKIKITKFDHHATICMEYVTIC